MREACLFSGYCWGSCPPMLVFEVLKRVRRTVSHVRFWRAVRHRYDGNSRCCGGMGESSLRSACDDVLA
jgi:hypothetical protein